MGRVAALAVWLRAPAHCTTDPDRIKSGTDSTLKRRELGAQIKTSRAIARAISSDYRFRRAISWKFVSDPDWGSIREKIGGDGGEVGKQLYMGLRQTIAKYGAPG